MHSNTKKLVTDVRKRRESLGLSLRKLAEMTGVSFATLSRLERAETEPDTNTVVRLINWLGQESENAFESENVAEVHFRASKNIDSETVKALMTASKAIREKYKDSAE